MAVHETVARVMFASRPRLPPPPPTPLLRHGCAYSEAFWSLGGAPRRGRLVVAISMAICRQGPSYGLGLSALRCSRLRLLNHLLVLDRLRGQQVVTFKTRWDPLRQLSVFAVATGVASPQQGQATYARAGEMR